MRIDPQVWHPPPSTPRTGAWGPSGSLDDVELVPVPGRGPEDVLVDDRGHVLTGLADGRIVRVDPESGASIDLADTGGRPLGLEWLPDGDVLVCDAERGLLRVPRDGGAAEVVAVRGGGPPVHLANNAAVEPDGTIWFTDSTQRHDLATHTDDLLAHSRTGRLLRRDPDGTLDEVLVGLTFASGVALSPDGDAVLVAATGDYALHRVEVGGERGGQATTLHESLPGFPDNLSTADDGIIWMAIPAARLRTIDLLHPRAPVLRRVVAALPAALRPAASRSAMAVGLRDDGSVVHNLQGSGKAYSFVTGVRAHGDWLYLGSLRGGATAIARVRRPA